jgi:hypothetical protein
MRITHWLTLSSVASLCLLPGCSRRTPPASDLFNQQAALPSTLPIPALEWKVISSSVDRQHGTMSTLTGNDIAVTSARSADSSYPEGSALALITWTVRHDPHWFGARIPARPQAVEIVSVTRGPDGKTLAKYQRFAGDPLTQRVTQLPEDASLAATRKADILSQRASVMP